MRKRLVLVVFIIAIAVLAVAVLSRRYGETVQRQMTAARTVIPQAQAELPEAEGRTSIVRGDTVIESLIPMQPDETLLNIVDMDFDGDGYDDQVNAVKVAGSPYIQLLVGMYNPQSKEYGRSVRLATSISQPRTFSYTGMDLVGDHSLALVYQGFAPNGSSVLRAYLVRKEGDAFSLQQIADISGEGTVYIEQLDRGESYEHNRARGQSYPIWMYSADHSRPDSTDQIQYCWEWNAARQSYVQSRQVRIAGSQQAAKDLASVQDGTVETFAAFLDGLWYKLDAATGELRYLFFTYAEQQIIFLLEDDAEVYTWENNTLQYRSMYITAANQEIETLRRKVNVSLLDIDRIRILIQDEVQMIISEENVWNGEYKKMKFSDFAAERDGEDDLSPPYIANLEAGPAWRAGDGTRIEFSGGSYRARNGSASDAGSYIALQVGPDSLVQFRSGSESPVLNGTYLLVYSPSVEDEAKPDLDRIILQPYVVRANEAYPADGRPVILSRSD